MTKGSAEVFEELRSHVFRVAYHMVGSASDAEDLVQDTWLRWCRVDPEEIASPRAWLTTAVTRLAVNYLESARVRREKYVGTWLPEPIPTSRSAPQHARMEIDESLSLAFLVILESLSPTERAVFLLHEAFGLRHGEIAATLGLEEANSRQILHRARAQVRARRPRFEASHAAQRELVERFREATGTGNLDRIAALLAEDVVALSDGGGKARATPQPVYGRDRVARLVHGAARKFVPADVSSMISEINGQPALVAWRDGRPFCVICADVSDGRIQTLLIVTNPDKLDAIGEGTKKAG